ncbi:MAG TPA: two-component regulator propeller domain-containing protein [Chitinophagaceae bacterium]|nr:two-component regulator propeller domain-containing protein [Chitinophagaceae bacterium]
MKGLFYLLILLTTCGVKAQLPSISFTNISLNQGLSQSSVVDICFDAKGFVWLATQDGLNRYDGKNFFLVSKTFDDITSGSSNRLGRIITGTDNCLWIISRGGQLEKHDLIKNSFKAINIVSGGSKLLISSLLEEKNEQLWLGTTTGEVLRYDVKANKVIEEICEAAWKGTAINALFKDRSGMLWVIGNRIGHLQDHHIVEDAIEDKKITNRAAIFSSIVEDREGNLWIGSFGAGLFVKRRNEPIQPFKDSGIDLAPDLVIEDVLSDDDGNIWLGTYGKGVFILNEREGNIRQFINDKKNPYSIAFNDVLRIKQDSNKGIWLGTDGGGVSYYNKQSNNFILFSDQTLPQNIEIAMVRSVAVDTRGVVWAGTSNKGLTKIDYLKGSFKTWRFPSFKKGISNADRIVSLFIDEDNMIWLGTQGNGILIFDSRKEKIIRWFHPDAAAPLKIPDATAWCMYPTSQQEVWIGTEKSGLCLFGKGKNFIANYAPPNGIDAIRSIINIDDSTLCVGFAKTGVQFFDTKRRRFKAVKAKPLADFFNAETSIKSLFYKKPFLYVGTDGRGMFVYNHADEKSELITTNNGLPNNTIYGILPDEKGHLWVSTNKGISRFKLNAIGNKISPSDFVNYASVQGLQSNEFNTGAYFKSADGKLLFGGIGGLNIFDPAMFEGEAKVVPVVFTDIQVDNKPTARDSAAPYKNIITLSSKNHSIAFTYAALNFASARQYAYYYKLEGYDKEWIHAGQRNYASYTSIPPGQYNFLVKYVQQGNAEGGLQAGMMVQVNGPFWKKGWFIAILCFIAIAIGYGFYKYRIAQLLAVFRIRQRIATDLHDDIGSTLSNINILSELSKKNLHNPLQANIFLQRISEEVQASSQSLDDIIWTVNINNDTWQETFGRMRRYATELFESGDTACHIKLDERVDMIKINMEKRRDIFLIYKELLNNIYKHAGATEVWIDMRFEDQQLLMAVKDNGKGFDKDLVTHRNGLKNLNTRVNRWKGSIKITTGVGGTSIQVII